LGCPGMSCDRGLCINPGRIHNGTYPPPPRPAINIMCNTTECIIRSDVLVLLTKHSFACFALNLTVYKYGKIPNLGQVP
jgi:hypothetical protein